MGRIGILDKISDEIEVENNRDNTWLIAYDFPKSKGNPHFYTLFKQLLNKLNGGGARADRIQSSIFLTDDFRGAIIATKLAQYYNADVHIFKVDEYDLFSFKRRQKFPDFEFEIEEEEVPVVMKAVYLSLKKHYEIFSLSAHNEIYELTTFLRVSASMRRTPIISTRKDLNQILKEFEEIEFLDSESIFNKYSPVSFGLQDFNFIPIIKAVGDYLDKPYLDSTDNDIIDNLFRRIEKEDIPTEIMREIEEFL